MSHLPRQLCWGIYHPPHCTNTSTVAELFLDSKSVHSMAGDKVQLMKDQYPLVEKERTYLCRFNVQMGGESHQLITQEVRYYC